MTRHIISMRQGNEKIEVVFPLHKFLVIRLYGGESTDEQTLLLNLYSLNQDTHTSR